MDSGTTVINNAGGNQAVNTQSPYQGLRWCVATVGIHPSRNWNFARFSLHRPNEGDSGKYLCLAVQHRDV
ncbi:hypothetical protein [Sphingorhabdus sp. SMR4y]|uniref:hypothetical protein n=1 Tax=Sphingorhabdus sp. SMR4y TaxID=2584094 RepID=UPI000B60D062|nr:hypothetical protein [Sphingorhabdus sp. SMR4y]ASK89866.1 hypothetical protein SPHFLASMR4Y_03136 [Sphingorhabdus sp. SMR4y]